MAIGVLLVKPGFQMVFNGRWNRTHLNQRSPSISNQANRLTGSHIDRGYQLFALLNPRGFALSRTGYTLARRWPQIGWRHLQLSPVPGCHVKTLGNMCQNGGGPLKMAALPSFNLGPETPSNNNASCVNLRAIAGRVTRCHIQRLR